MPHLSWELSLRNGKLWNICAVDLDSCRQPCRRWDRSPEGAEQFTLLKRSEVMSGVSDGLLPAQMIPTDHWTFSVVSVARIRCVPPEARPSLLRESEVTGSEKMLKRQWIPFTGWMKLVFCFGSKIKTKPSQALAVSCQWIPTSPWALEFTPSQPKRGK